MRGKELTHHESDLSLRRCAIGKGVRIDKGFEEFGRRTAPSRRHVFIVIGIAGVKQARVALLGCQGANFVAVGGHLCVLWYTYSDRSRS